MTRPEVNQSWQQGMLFTLLFSPLAVAMKSRLGCGLNMKTYSNGHLLPRL